MKQSRTGRQKYVLNSSCPNGILVRSGSFKISFLAKAQSSQGAEGSAPFVFLLEPLHEISSKKVFMAAG